MVTLAENGYVVIPLHNTKPLHSNSLRLDITNTSEVLNLFNKLKPDAVIHMVSETNVDRCEIEKEHARKTNVEGTRNIAIACKSECKNCLHFYRHVFDG